MLYVHGKGGFASRAGRSRCDEAQWLCSRRRLRGRNAVMGVCMLRILLGRTECTKVCMHTAMQHIAMEAQTHCWKDDEIFKNEPVMTRVGSKLLG